MEKMFAVLKLFVLFSSTLYLSQNPTRIFMFEKKSKRLRIQVYFSSYFLKYDILKSIEMLFELSNQNI